MRIALTGARAPATLELASRFAADGVDVDLVDSAPWALGRWSRAHGPLFRIPSPRHESEQCAARLRELSAARHWQAIVPTCEEIFHLARWVADDPQRLGAPLWAPPFATLAGVHHKGAFVTWAEAAGLPVPQTFELTTPLTELPRASRHGAWVLKPAWSRFGTRVHLIGNSDPWPATVVPSMREPWILQRRLHGTPWCSWSVARSGELLAHSAYRVEATAGPIGAAIAFEMQRHVRIEAWVAQFVAVHELTGQFAFDFIDTADGPLPLECNPRLTSGVHGYRGTRGVGDALVCAFSSVDASAPRSVIHPADGQRFTSAIALRTYRQRASFGADLLDIPNDSRPRRLQLLSYGWLMAAAAWRHMDPRAYSTHDIEWNGPASDRSIGSV